MTDFGAHFQKTGEELTLINSLDEDCLQHGYNRIRCIIIQMDCNRNTDVYTSLGTRLSTLIN